MHSNGVRKSARTTTPNKNYDIPSNKSYTPDTPKVDIDLGNSNPRFNRLATEAVYDGGSINSQLDDLGMQRPNTSNKYSNLFFADSDNGNVYTDKIRWGINEVYVRPEGKGFWGKRIKQSHPRVDSYELKLNPNNESYYLPHPEGGYVQFENMINDTVQDGKLILKQKSFYHVNDLPDFAKNKVLQEAQRQVEAATAAGYKVEWLVSEQKAAQQLSDFFKDKNINIRITYYPE